MRHPSASSIAGARFSCRARQAATLVVLIVGLTAAGEPGRSPSETSRPGDGVQDEKAPAELESLLTRLESDLSDDSKLKESLRNLKTLECSQDLLGKEGRARLVAARRNFELKRLEVLSKAARADEEAAGADLEAALRTYDKTMRELRDVFVHAPIKGPDGRPITPDPLIEACKALIRRSDDLVQRLVTPAYIESVPTRDMLSWRERKFWGGSRNGVRSEWTKDALIVSHLPPDEDRSVTGIYSLDGWNVEWCDYVFDFEFTILAGRFGLLLRYRPDGYAYYTMFFGDGEAGYEKERCYRMTVKVIGSMVGVEPKDEPPATDRLKPFVSRTGGIGIAVEPGSKVLVKALKLKVLRPRGGN